MMPGPTPRTRTSTVNRWIAHHPIVAFVALAYAMSWLFWGAAFALGTDSALGAAAFVAGGFGPGAAAALVLWAGAGSLGRWARSIVRWRVPGRFWAYALGLPALLYAVANLVLVVLGEEVRFGLLGDRLVPYLGTFVLTMFLLGGQEELGWRGFALPRLEARFGPLGGTVVLGLIWSVWHLPLGPLAMIVPFFLAFFYTWLYNRTGSVLLAILLHASFTPAQDHLLLQSSIAHGAADAAIGIAYLLGIVVLLIVTRGRLGFGAEANARHMP